MYSQSKQTSLVNLIQFKKDHIIVYSELFCFKTWHAEKAWEHSDPQMKVFW